MTLVKLPWAAWPWFSWMCPRCPTSADRRAAQNPIEEPPLPSSAVLGYRCRYLTSTVLRGSCRLRAAGAKKILRVECLTISPPYPRLPRRVDRRGLSYRGWRHPSPVILSRRQTTDHRETLYRKEQLAPRTMVEDHAERSTLAWIGHWPACHVAHAHTHVRVAARLWAGHGRLVPSGMYCGTCMWHGMWNCRAFPRAHESL